MQVQKTIGTWAGKSSFKYSGSVQEGTKISYGEMGKYTININREQFTALINHFKGQTVEAGTSRTNPPKGSVGNWLQENITKTATASYICPILINENYAVKVGNTAIRFF
jgi:hypothetical protein